MLSSEADGIAPSPTPHPQAFCPSYAKTCAFYRRGGFIKTAATWNGRSRRNLAVHQGLDEGRVAVPFADPHHCGVHDLRPRKPRREQARATKAPRVAASFSK